MEYPKTYEELAILLETTGPKVLFFTANWCGDCQFIYPSMPDIETEHSDYTFIRVDRDEFMELAREWDILGIPSFVVIDDGKELGRLVNKNRKTKAEIDAFLKSIGR